MTIWEVWHWLDRLLGQFGSTFMHVIEWTGIMTSQFFWIVITFFRDWLPKVLYLLVDGYKSAEYFIIGIRRNIKKALDDLWPRTNKLISTWWPRIEKVFSPLWTRVLDYLQEWFLIAKRYFMEWLWKALRVFVTWWEWVYKWFDEWCPFFVKLFEKHKKKILYCLTDGWPHVWWFIWQRWFTIFPVIENWIEGWETFIQDPAQAIWDWFEPRALEIVEDFLYKVWWGEV